MKKYKKCELTGKLCLFRNNGFYPNYNNKIIVLMGESEKSYGFYLPDGKITGWRKEFLNSNKQNDFHIKILG